MQQPVKSVAEDVMGMLGGEISIEKIMERVGQYQLSVLSRDLKILNATLLPALQISNAEKVETSLKSFTKEYLGLPEKTYSYVRFIENKQEKESKEQLPPFVPNYSNINDTYANSKQLLKKSSVGVTDKSPNLSNLLASTIKSTFFGEQKATYPTIVYQGSQPHPIRNYENPSMIYSKNSIGQGLQTIGGMRDSLTKIGLESISLKKKKILESSKFSQINPDLLKATNTRVSKVEESLPVAPIENPFIRRPSQKK